MSRLRTAGIAGLIDQLEQAVTQRVRTAQLRDPEFVSLATVEAPTLTELRSALDDRTASIVPNRFRYPGAFSQMIGRPLVFELSTTTLT